MRRTLLGALALFLVTTSCGDDLGSGVAGCSDQVELSVGLGVVPTFTWSPECAIFALTVTPEMGQQNLWTIFSSNNSNSIDAPITYGVVPDGAVENGPATLLEAGVIHRVTVSALSGGVQEVAGTQVFTTPP
jgi:hypothetical protein